MAELHTLILLEPKEEKFLPAITLPRAIRDQRDHLPNLRTLCITNYLVHDPSNMERMFKVLAKFKQVCYMQIEINICHHISAVPEGTLALVNKLPRGLKILVVHITTLPPDPIAHGQDAEMWFPDWSLWQEKQEHPHRLSEHVSRATAKHMPMYVMRYQ